MNFGQALESLKLGSKVAREGWNGKGMWIQLYRPDSDEGIVAVIDGEGKWIPLAPHILMKTATSEFVPWIASQTDILAEDWNIVLGD